MAAAYKAKTWRQVDSFVIGKARHEWSRRIMRLFAAERPLAAHPAARTLEEVRSALACDQSRPGVDLATNLVTSVANAVASGLPMSRTRAGLRGSGGTQIGVSVAYCVLPRLARRESRAAKLREFVDGFSLGNDAPTSTMAGGSCHTALVVRQQFCQKNPLAELSRPR